MSARPRATAALMLETGLNDERLQMLVGRFYGEAIRDPHLGPIFERNVLDWEAHCDRMVDFWSSVILLTGRYHGQVLQKHSSLPLAPVHFSRWLELFEETARKVAPSGADALISKAHKIAACLQLSAASDRPPTN